MQVFAEELMGFAQTAELAERGVLKILGVDAETVRDMVGDGVEPASLVFCEICTRGLLVGEPFCVVPADGLGDGDEGLIRLDGVTNEGDEIREAGAALAFHLLRLDGFV